ncbi:MAG: hypothetical protein DLM50_01305 [Candidatus Meridianibacter frigidus]|nr:MAG: hypothetical protein DLM50_01305 [Candidatus Eremiobacteraeota bacterium]
MHPSANAFDYLIILLSIILGLAIATLLGNFARLIDNRERIKLYWVSVLWAILLFLIQIQHWWSEYALQSVAHWTFGLFLLVLLTPVGLFLLSSIVLPQTIDGNEDIEAWYYRNRVWFFSIWMTLPLISFAKDAVNGSFAWNLNNGLQLIAFFLLGTALFTENRRAHAALVIVLAALIFYYLVALFVQLPG